MENRLIAHSLIKAHGKYLVIRRNKIKRGQKNVYPAYWDIPGGRVEPGELPRMAAIRECREEVGLEIELENIIHEDSNLDGKLAFTRLVYAARLLVDSKTDVNLDFEEHDQYRWITGLGDLAGENVVPYLKNLLDKKQSNL
ncbi:NUDIX hydrolase [Ligilactobacillus agilis]|uniref:NUDIX hydrolase n=1 Tax=Ligilactobacillus agilis TaxID=1601 RepID=UPI00067F4D01|nr:NUDIX hydrolase [Ligilactobacillus agilis]UNL42435.1 NUDIX hydrolase [Ligilactobacillus agilis]UNL57517.1 NUDIX hydrolase [Ligilactobacillus agilis]